MLLQQRSKSVRGFSSLSPDPAVLRWHGTEPANGSPKQCVVLFFPQTAESYGVDRPRKLWGGLVQLSGRVLEGFCGCWGYDPGLLL